MSKLLKIFAVLALLGGAFLTTIDTASAQRRGGGGFRAGGVPAMAYRGGGMRVGAWRGGMRVAGWRGARWYGARYAYAPRWRGGWYGRRWYARRYWGPGYAWWGWPFAAGLGLAAAGAYAYDYPYYYGAYAMAPNCGWVRIHVRSKGKLVHRRAWRCWPA